MLITLKHDITLFTFMMMFNWGPPDFPVILWLSYPPVRYLDTIGGLRAKSVKWIWISLHVFVFHHILLLDYKTLSQRLARQKQGASMDVSMVSMVWVWWVWCEYGVSMDGCHSSLSAAQPQSLPLASFLSCIFFLQNKGVLLYQNIMYNILNLSVPLHCLSMRT